MSLSANVNEKAALIWAIADKLTGVYKPHEYGEVILPLTVIRRFDCILADTKDAVLEKYEHVKNLPMKDILLRNVSGKAFYNTSKYTFERLLDDPDNIEANFRDYLNGFSENVLDIFEKFRFDGQITIGVAENSPLFEQATEQGGYFFRQYPAVDKGVMVENNPENASFRRALCLLNGKVCIIACTDRVLMNDFSASLVKLGVRDAILLVGGTADGWYRDSEGNINTLSTSVAKNAKYINSYVKIYLNI